MPTEHRWCPSCRAERLFEVPRCADGSDLDCSDLDCPDLDCPERACVDCGIAIVVGPTLINRRPPVRLAVDTAA